MMKKLDTLGDNELFYLLKGGDKTAAEAFDEIYSRHSKRIFMYCRRILNNQQQAEDIFQDTFLSFYNNAQKDITMTNVPAYLLRIARNLCLKSKSKNHQSLVFIEDLNLSVNENSLEKHEMQNIISSSLNLIPDEWREAVVLQVYDGLSYNEIAEIMEVPMSTVRNWIVRGKKQLREIISPYFNEVPLNNIVN